MALLKGKLFTGALFAGLLLSGQQVAQTPDVVPELPVKVVTATSGGNLSTKIHLAELYANKQLNKDIELKNKLIQQDEELLTIISFMVANKIIV